MSQTHLHLTPRTSSVPPGWVAGNKGVLQGLVCLMRRWNWWHPFAVFSMWNVTCCHLSSACTTHAEDKHCVLRAKMFTLLPDVLLEQFDCTNNKWASKRVFLKAFEAQGWGVMCSPKLAWQWCVAGPLSSWITPLQTKICLFLLSLPHSKVLLAVF